MKSSEDLVLPLINGEPNKSSCCAGRPTDEDPRKPGSSKFSREVEVELLEPERKFPGGDNPREL